MSTMTLGDMVTDIFQTGKDIFIQREATKDYLERQSGNIETQRVLSETTTSESAAESGIKASTLVYIGGVLIALAIFVKLYKSI